MNLHGSLLLFLSSLSGVICHENPNSFGNIIDPHNDDAGAPAHGHHGNMPPQPPNQPRPPIQPPNGANPAARHGRPPSPPRDNRLRDKTHTHNEEHVKEHLNNVVKMEQENLSEEELQFHYFKLHDYDKNNLLDGIELISAVTHFHGDDGEKPHGLPDDDIAEIVDSILRDEDRNNDGYIDYSEFILSQRSPPS